MLTFPQVLVPAELVGSSDFRAETGDRIEVLLTTGSDHWTPAAGPDAAVPIPGSVDMLLTGVALPFDHLRPLGGWALAVDGIPIYVASSYPNPSPQPGRRVELRGTLEVADGYLVDEVQEALPAPATRSWLIRRILHFDPRSRKTQPDPVTSIRWTADPCSYLIDLTTPAAATKRPAQAR
ncbi:hypothetical protein [Actinoplanes sp. HUAS TT8]|uniref:hypothetical protein n=1 Tax=Actinoplanes sp. HUAS TT8 TaxID=3447453 RepID=UPI003F51B1A9